MKPRRVAFIGFDQVNALDVVGPAEAFASALVDGEGGPVQGYAVTILAASLKPFRSESGIVFKPQHSLNEALAIDTLIVPGGRGLRVPRTTALVAAWITKQAPRIRRIGSVCTGAGIDSVAASVGFASADSFRRAFERRFGIPPGVYRRRFGGRNQGVSSRTT